MARRDLTYYYDSPGRRHSDTRRRRLSIFDWLILVVTLAVAAGMALSWMARWIAPASYGFMSGAGLFAPVLYVANFLCLLYWVIRWRKVVYVPLTVFVAGLWALTLFFRPQFTQSHADHSHDRSLLKVMTYNVRGMVRPVSEASSRMRSSMNEVVAVVDSLRPDILCMQEFSSTRRNPSSGFDAALPLYHYKRTGFTAATGGPAGHGWGNAIYSKYPIVGSGVKKVDTQLFKYAREGT